MVTDDESQTTMARTRILRAAAQLLSDTGRDAVTTRSVAAAAGVQPPAIYRLFGDKDGLLEKVAEQAVREYLTNKQAMENTSDPMRDLADLWDLHIRFGLANPACYLLVFAEPKPTRTTAARDEAIALLRRAVERVAAAGLLRTSVERAVGVIQASGVGVVVTQLALPPEDRDAGLAAAAWDSLRKAAVSEAEPTPSAADPKLLAGYAGRLRQALMNDPGEVLTPSEQALLIEWLDRLAVGHR